MTDLIKALAERREELRNELQEHLSFQEYELVCRLLEHREASVSIPSSLRPKAPQRKPAPQQQPVDRPLRQVPLAAGRPRPQPALDPEDRDWSRRCDACRAATATR